MARYTKETLENLLRKVAGKVINRNPQDIDFNANLRGDLGMDSIDLFDILGLLSQELDVNLYPEDFKEVNTIAEFLDRLTLNLDKQADKARES